MKLQGQVTHYPCKWGSASARHFTVGTMAPVVAQALTGATPSCAISIKLFGLLDRSTIPFGLANRIVVANFTRVCRKRNGDQSKRQDSNRQSTCHLDNPTSFNNCHISAICGATATFE
jgi:hypothetical protein